MNISGQKFNDDEIKKLKKYRDKQSDIRLKLRFIAILMLAQNIDIETVALIIGKSIKIIENWHRQYVTKGIDSLNFFSIQTQESLLDARTTRSGSRLGKEDKPRNNQRSKRVYRRAF